VFAYVPKQKNRPKVGAVNTESQSIIGESPHRTLQQ